MKLKSFIGILATVAIASFGTACNVRGVSAERTVSPQQVQLTTSTPTKVAQANEQEVQFVCKQSYDPKSKQRVPTTFAWAQGRKIPIVRWKFPWFENSDYPPQQRCEEVSSRFQTAYKNSSLDYITNGTENNQPVICTARQLYGACDTTLLTLRPEDDSVKIARQLKEVLDGLASGAIDHGSGKKQVYYRIDMEKFLQTVPLEEE